MGKHSASRPGRTPTPDESSAAATPTAPAAPTTDGRAPRDTTPPDTTPGDRTLPASLAQTAALGAIGVLVAVIALIWAGVDGRTAAATGLGLLLLGAVAVLVVHRAGLLGRGR